MTARKKTRQPWSPPWASILITKVYLLPNTSTSGYVPGSAQQGLVRTLRRRPFTQVQSSRFFDPGFGGSPEPPSQFDPLGSPPSSFSSRRAEPEPTVYLDTFDTSDAFADFFTPVVAKKPRKRSQKRAPEPTGPQSDLELEPELTLGFEPARDPLFEPKSVEEIEPESKLAYEQELEPAFEPESELRFEPELEQGFDPESESELEPGSELRFEAESDEDYDSEPVLEFEQESDPQVETESVLRFDPESELETEMELDPELQPESELDMELALELPAQLEPEPATDVESILNSTSNFFTSVSDDVTPQPLEDVDTLDSFDPSPPIPVESNEPRRYAPKYFAPVTPMPELSPRADSFGTFCLPAGGARPEPTPSHGSAGPRFFLPASKMPPSGTSTELVPFGKPALTPSSPGRPMRKRPNRANLARRLPTPMVSETQQPKKVKQARRSNPRFFGPAPPRSMSERSTQFALVGRDNESLSPSVQVTAEPPKRSNGRFFGGHPPPEAVPPPPPPPRADERPTKRRTSRRSSRDDRSDIGSRIGRSGQKTRRNQESAPSPPAKEKTRAASVSSEIEESSELTPEELMNPNGLWKLVVDKCKDDDEKTQDKKNPTKSGLSALKKVFGIDDIGKKDENEDDDDDILTIEDVLSRGRQLEDKARRARAARQTQRELKVSRNFLF